MPRVIGIDPGTVSIDLCGLDDGEVFLDRSLPTAEALADPALLPRLLEEAGDGAPLDLIAGPSGYGLPFVRAADATETDLRLAQLTAEGEQSGGIGGLGRLMRQLARSPVPVIYTPGVIHLASVPPHRKVNRVDMGTADKVCAAALAVSESAARHAIRPADVSLILLEVGGAFTAALAIDRGRIVDGCGGTSGPLGARAAGALDGEVAFLAGSVSKRMLFGGGASTIAGTADAFEARATAEGRLAWDAYVEGTVKAVAAMHVSVRRPLEVVLSGRLARTPGLVEELAGRLAVSPDVPVRVGRGFAAISKEAAQGAALIADGLAGGKARELVEAMALRDAHGTVLDHLFVISAAAARARLGIG
jgi:predicted butyrate kinase (DUF1464 family)